MKYECEVCGKLAKVEQVPDPKTGELILVCRPCLGADKEPD